MNSQPTHERLQRDEVMQWLAGEGIKRKTVAKLMALGVIHGAPLFAGGRKVYSKSQIQRDVLDKHSAACGGGKV